MAAAEQHSSQAKQPLRLHIVTGKGGTGKTTVAAALALALAAGGKKVLLCEVEGRQGIAQLFDVAPLPYEERRVAVAPDGGQVYALAIDPEAALLEYLEMYYKLGRAGRALDRFGVTDFVTTIAPGLRDVLLTGKVYEAVRRINKDGSHTYDALVLDAPPTGRISRFLNVNREVAGLAKIGPIRNQADSIMRLMRSKRTAIHLVTLLEEMPVQETIDAIAELRSADLPVGSVVINLVHSTPLSPGSDRLLGNLDVDCVADILASAGVGSAPAVAKQLLATGADHQERLELQQEQQDVLSALDNPRVTLPQLPDGVDLGGLYDLAELLREQGLA